MLIVSLRAAFSNVADASRRPGTNNAAISSIALSAALEFTS